jgi:drug/metabolite transporter (DMT)-like permease
MTWFFFAFLTALFEALKDVASKKTMATTNEYVVAWGWMLFPLPFLATTLLFQGIPPIGERFWLALVAGVIIVLSSFNLYMKAIKASDLSVTLPMIAFTPLFLLITSPLIVGEFPRPMGLVGIVFIVIGSYVLNIKQRKHGWLAPYKALLHEPGPRLMLLVAFIWSIGANVDKVGVSNSSPFFWLTMIYLCTGLIMTPVVLWHTKSPTEIPRHLKHLIVIGFFMAMAGMSQMTAITMTLVPYVISVKRTSILMGVIFGTLIFKEKGIRERLSGVIIMIVGVVLITLS